MQEDTDLRNFIIGAVLIIAMSFTCLSYERYVAKEITIEAIKAGLVQDVNGKWVNDGKSK